MALTILVSGYLDVVDEQPQAEVAEEADPPPQALAQAAGASPGSVWDDPRIPWSGRPRRVDILLWAGIMLSGIYYWALLPFVAPLVGTRPVLLEVLNGNTAAIISAAAFVRVGHGSLVVVLLAAIPGLMKFDLLYWWAGCGASGSSRSCPASVTAAAGTWTACTGGVASSPGPPW